MSMQRMAQNTKSEKKRKRLCAGVQQGKNLGDRAKQSQSFQHRKSQESLGCKYVKNKLMWNFRVACLLSWSIEAQLASPALPAP